MTTLGPFPFEAHYVDNSSSCVAAAWLVFRLLNFLLTLRVKNVSSTTEQDEVLLRFSASPLEADSFDFNFIPLIQTNSIIDRIYKETKMVND